MILRPSPRPGLRRGLSARPVLTLLGLALAAPSLYAGAQEISQVGAAQLAPDPHGVEMPAVALRWEPVTRHSRYWVGSNGPAHLGEAGTSRLRLESGGEAVVLLPASGWLRIEAQGNTSSAPRVSLSSGTGVAVEAAVHPSLDGRAWLLRTALPQAAVAHLRAPDGSSQALYGVFVARHEIAPPLHVPRAFVHLPGAPVRVRLADQAVPEPYVRVPAGERIEVEVRGPARFELQARLDGGAELSGALLVLETSLEAGAQQPRGALQQRLPSGGELRAPVEVDGQWQAIGRLERLALEVPPGLHRLWWRGSHAILARLVALDSPGLLLDRNTPAAWSDDMPDADTTRWLQDAIAAATSNRWRDIGSTVAQQVQQAASQRPQHPALTALANELEGLVGQWNGVPPADATSASENGSAVVMAAATLSRSPLDPIRNERVAIARVDTFPPLWPATLFHRVEQQPRRFELPPAQHPRRLRVRVLEPARTPALLAFSDSTGRSWQVRAGAPVLSQQQLTPEAAAVSAQRRGADSAAVPPAVPLLMESGDAQWWLPAGATSLTVRALEGHAMVALEWRGSGEFGLDDGAAAELVRHQLAAGPRPSIPALSVLAEDAWRPIERLARASLAQLSSGVQAPPSLPPVAASRAVHAAALARLESDPARALAHWTLARRALDPDLRREALLGQAAALRASTERVLAEQTLRAAWLSDDPVLIATAFTELQAMYALANEDETQLVLAAAAVARDPAQAGDLAARLGASGDDRLALTAALAAPQPLAMDRAALLPALLTSALRARMPATFEALLATVAMKPGDTAFWRGVHALHTGRAEQAVGWFQQAGQAEWVRHVELGREIGAALAQAPSQAAVQDWLAWQASHPGPRHGTPEPAALALHGGGLVVRSVARNLRSFWWRATVQQPLELKVVGPARLRVEARPLHPAPDLLLEGWLKVEGEGQLWIQPYERNRTSPGLEIEGDARATLGERIERVIDLPTGLHRLRIHAGDQAVVARYQVERPALQAGGLPVPSAAHFEPATFRVPQATSAAACGAAGACLVTLPGSPATASRVELEPVGWPGLPLPPRKHDLAAARLASGDTLGAVQAASNPAEKMRLLAWLAGTQPDQRARAVAMAAQLRGSSTDPELLAAWQRVSRDTEWVLQPLLTRSAGLRSLPMAYGEPRSPAARLRAALLEPLGERELRLSGDTRAVFTVADPGQTRTLIHLRAEDVPVLAPQPLTVQVQVNGRTLQEVRLASPGSADTLAVELPAGEHGISVGLVNSYANQTLRVRFDIQGPALPQLMRDWQIATPEQPVLVTVAAPAWLRVDKLDSSGQVRSEERFVEAEGVQTLGLSTEPGAPESLYRVYLRQHTSGASVIRPPRPNLYRPETVPLPPAHWVAAPAVPPARAVQFEDAVPVAQRRDSTWTPRLALHQRLDTEATGGSIRTRKERFAEAGVTWVRRSADGASWRMADALTREAQRGSPVLGLRMAATEAIGWLPVLPLPLELTASAAGFAQSTFEGLGASVQAHVSVAQTHRLAPNLMHRPQLGAFARYSNLRNLDPAQLDRIDTDVYSNYRQQHRFGLTLGHTLAWQPWRDTDLTLDSRIVSNENFTLDNLQLEVRGQQLAGNWLLGAGLRHKHYLSDRHRAGAIGVTEPVLSIGREQWAIDGRRWELRFTVRRDSLTRTLSGGLELLWHQSAGRFLWDMGPGDRDFRELREWRRAPALHRAEDVR